MLALLLTVLVVHLMALASPGPDFLLVLKVSLFEGRRPAFAAALGIALGIAVHVIYGAMGIALLIEKLPWVYSAIRYLGSAYLIWLGISCLRAKAPASNLAENNSPRISLGAQARDGFLTNLLNPKATLYVLSLFTQVIKPSTPTEQQVVVAFLLVAITFVWFALLAYALTHKRLRPLVARVQARMLPVMGLLMIGLGVYVAISR